MTDTIVLGETAVIDFTFARYNAKDRRSKVPIDPTTITVTITRPDGTVDTYAKAQLSNPEVGRYRLHYTPAAASGGAPYRVKAVAGSTAYTDEFSVARTYTGVQRKEFLVAP